MQRIKVNKTIDEMKISHHLNKIIANNLKHEEGKTSEFEIANRIHKEGYPGRPISNLS